MLVTYQTQETVPHPIFKYEDRVEIIVLSMDLEK